jgi:hypothetical protein
MAMEMEIKRRQSKKEQGKSRVVVELTEPPTKSVLVSNPA